MCPFHLYSFICKPLLKSLRFISIHYLAQDRHEAMYVCLPIEHLAISFWEKMKISLYMQYFISVVGQAGWQSLKQCNALKHKISTK